MHKDMERSREAGWRTNVSGCDRGRQLDWETGTMTRIRTSRAWVSIGGGSTFELQWNNDEISHKVQSWSWMSVREV